MLLEINAPTTEAHHRIYDEAKRRAVADGSLIFLGDLFNNISEPLFIDWVHLGPRGNQIVAEAIAQSITKDPSLQPVKGQRLF